MVLRQAPWLESWGIGSTMLCALAGGGPPHFGRNWYVHSQEENHEDWASELFPCRRPGNPKPTGLVFRDSENRRNLGSSLRFHASLRCVCVCVCVFSSLGDIRRPMTQPSTVWQPGRKDDEPVRKAKRPNIGTTSERH